MLRRVHRTATRALEVLGPLRHHAWGLFAASAGQALLVTAQPLLFSRIIDGVFESWTYSLLLWYVAALFVVHAVRTLLELVHQWLEAQLGFGVAVSFQTSILDHCMRFRHESAENAASGTLISTLKDDVATVQAFYSETMPGLFHDLWLLLLSIWVLFRISPVLLVPTLVLTALVHPAYRLFAAKVRAMRNEERFLEASNTQWMSEVLAAYPTALQYGVTTYLARQHRQLAGKWSEAGRRLRVYRTLGPCLAESAGDVVRVLVVLGGGVVVAAGGGITAGELTAYYLLVSRLTAPWVRVFRFGASFNTFLVSQDRIDSVLRLPAEHALRSGETDGNASSLYLDQVSYAYTGERTWHLAESSFAVRRGQTKGLVGPTGSGKSTVLRIMCGLLEPCSGRVWVDSDVANRSDLRMTVALAPANPFLFTASMRDNILLGRPCTPEYLQEVVRCTRLAEVIQLFGDGLDQVLLHSGGGLSTGQKQRIGIARALIGRPSFVLLDEATSGLDPQTEQAVISGIRQLLPSVGLVVCTHRLTTVSQLLSVAVVVAGRIVSEGSHEQLLSENSTYAAMWQSMAETRGSPS